MIRPVRFWSASTRSRDGGVLSMAALNDWPDYTQGQAMALVDIPRGVVPPGTGSKVSICTPSVTPASSRKSGRKEAFWSIRKRRVSSLAA